jgi:hypothetical protein
MTTWRRQRGHVLSAVCAAMQSCSFRGLCSQCRLLAAMQVTRKHNVYGALCDDHHRRITPAIWLNHTTAKRPPLKSYRLHLRLGFRSQSRLVDAADCNGSNDCRETFHETPPNARHDSKAPYARLFISVPGASGTLSTLVPGPTHAYYGFLPCPISLGPRGLPYVPCLPCLKRASHASRRSNSWLRPLADTTSAISLRAVQPC